MKFMKSVSSFWEKGVEFKGTASRSEYWWAQLFLFLCATFIQVFLQFEKQDTILLLFEVITFIPLVALTVRRFNDIKLPIWIPIVLLSIVLGIQIYSFPDYETISFLETLGLGIESFVMGACLVPGANKTTKKN